MGFLRLVLAATVAVLASYGSIALARSLGEHDTRQLDVRSKPALIKSFKTDYGIIDCVDMYKQPAFDNPLLKNHEIQVEPSHLPGTKEKSAAFRSSTRYSLDDTGNLFPGFQNGTVPIHRTTNEDLIRERSWGRIQAGYDPFINKEPNHLYAVMKIGKPYAAPFVAAKASINIRNPSVGEGATSGAQVWLYGGPEEIGGNHISAGWLVDPRLYGDDRTHFTAYWKGDGVSGCVNTQCPGFVQTNPNTPLGFILPDISTEKKLWDIPTHIYQDHATKNWWVAVGDNSVPIGYWPKELLPKFNLGANSLAYGGVVRAVPGEPDGPWMGAAIVDCSFEFSAYFSNIQYKILAQNSYLAPNWALITEQADCPGYKVQRPCGDTKEREFSFFYGGNGLRCRI